MASYIELIVVYNSTKHANDFFIEVKKLHMDKNFLPWLFQFFQKISNFPDFPWASNKLPDFPWLPWPSQNPVKGMIEESSWKIGATDTMWDKSHGLISQKWQNTFQ